MNFRTLNSLLSKKVIQDVYKYSLYRKLPINSNGMSYNQMINDFGSALYNPKQMQSLVESDTSGSAHLYRTMAASLAFEARVQLDEYKSSLLEELMFSVKLAQKINH